MDRFFMTLVFIVTSAMIISLTSMFENKASAETYKQGIEAYIMHSPLVVTRSPAVMPNNK